MTDRPGIYRASNGQFLWAMILRNTAVARGRAIRAHLIAAERGPMLVAGCGLEFNPGGNPRGWQTTKPGVLPLAARFVCCGTWVASYRRDGTWSCVLDHVARPCGSCGPCRQIAAAR